MEPSRHPTSMLLPLGLELHLSRAIMFHQLRHDSEERRTPAILCRQPGLCQASFGAWSEHGKNIRREHTLRESRFPGVGDGNEVLVHPLVHVPRSLDFWYDCNGHAKTSSEKLVLFVDGNVR